MSSGGTGGGGGGGGGGAAPLYFVAHDPDYTAPTPDDAPPAAPTAAAAPAEPDLYAYVDAYKDVMKEIVPRLPRWPGLRRAWWMLRFFVSLELLWLASTNEIGAITTGVAVAIGVFLTTFPSIGVCDVIEALALAAIRFPTMASQATIFLNGPLSVTRWRAFWWNAWIGEIDEPCEYHPCVACATNKRVVMSSRCGHNCLCFECSARVVAERGLCPMCRGPWEDLVRVYN